jgi:hypothetical protein
MNCPFWGWRRWEVCASTLLSKNKALIWVSAYFQGVNALITAKFKPPSYRERKEGNQKDKQKDLTLKYRKLERNALKHPVVTSFQTQAISWHLSYQFWPWLPWIWKFGWAQPGLLLLPEPLNSSTENTKIGFFRGPESTCRGGGFHSRFGEQSPWTAYNLCPIASQCHLSLVGQVGATEDPSAGEKSRAAMWLEASMLGTLSYPHHWQTWLSAAPLPYWPPLGWISNLRVCTCTCVGQCSQPHVGGPSDCSVEPEAPPVPVLTENCAPGWSQRHSRTRFTVNACWMSLETDFSLTISTKNIPNDLT